MVEALRQEHPIRNPGIGPIAVRCAEVGGLDEHRQVADRPSRTAQAFTSFRLLASVEGVHAARRRIGGRGACLGATASRSPRPVRSTTTSTRSPGPAAAERPSVGWLLAEFQLRLRRFQAGREHLRQRHVERRDPRNVPDSGNRRGEKLVPGTQKIVIGCMEMGPADSADDLPIG